MIQFTICHDFLTHLNDASQSFMTDTLANISSEMRPFAISLFTIYLMWLGVKFYLGRANVQEIVPQMFRISIVFSMVTNPAMYNQFFGDWLWKLPESLAGLVLNGETTDTANFLDGLLSQFYDLKLAFANLASKKSTLGIPDFDFMLAGWIVLGAGIVLTMYALLIVALSKVAIAILLAVGPIFILMINFQSSRKFFDAWIGQIMTFSFTVMLLSAVIKLVISLLQSYLTGAVTIAHKPDIDPTIDQLVPIFMFCGVAILMLLQISSMAASLGGGIAISTLGSGKELGNRLSKHFESLKNDNTSKSNRQQTNSIENTSRKPVGIK